MPISGIVNREGNTKSGVMGKGGVEEALCYYGYMPSNMTSGGIIQWTNWQDTITENSMSSGVYTVNKPGYYETIAECIYLSTTTNTHYHALHIKQGNAVLMYTGYLGDYMTVANRNRNTATIISPWTYGQTMSVNMTLSGYTAYGSGSFVTTLAIKYLGTI